MRHLRLAIATSILLPTAVASAQDKKDEKKDAPRVTAVSPLAVAPGETVKLAVRGVKLDAGTGVRLEPTSAAGLTVKLTDKGKAEAAKDDMAKRYGDTKATVELTVPKDAPPADLKLVIETPDGPTPAVAVRVVPKDKLVDEKEPNGGFRSAQPVPAECVVRGAIGEEKDVDVYRVTGKAGQTLRAAVVAERAGSLADCSVTVYDAAGRVLATADDGPGTRDPAVELKLPADGDYLVSVIDANDKGGAGTHAYLLEIGVK